MSNFSTFYSERRKNTMPFYGAGFTIIEIIVAVAILMVISVFTLVALNTFRENQSLKNSVNETIALINQARSKTLSSQDFSQYGIHFESSRIVLFKGTIFSEPNPDNVVLTLASSIEISSISLDGGGVDLVFQKLTGKTDQFGSIIFRVKNDISKTKTIDIKNTGIVDVQ